MNLRNLREIKEFSVSRLEQSPSQRKIVLIYAGLALGLTALVTVASYILDLQIDNYGGLSNLSKRSMLTSVQSMLPLVQSLLTMCLEVGYVAAMLRIARGMYTSPQTLRLGFDRFWLLLRCALFKGMIMTGVMFICFYLGIMIFTISPFSVAAVEIVTPLISQVSAQGTSLVIDDVTYLALVDAMIPAFVICGLLILVLGGPIFYNYRMVNYVIIDKPAIGALMALRESKKMMRGNRLQLLKLDIHLWWYYLAMVIATVIGYGDMILPMVGLEIPMPETAAYFGFYGLYLAATFCNLFFLRNRVEVCYALAYDSLKPVEQQENGVVLGNIFQM